NNIIKELFNMFKQKMDWNKFMHRDTQIPLTSEQEYTLQQAETKSPQILTFPRSLGFPRPNESMGRYLRRDIRLYGPAMAQHFKQYAQHYLSNAKNDSIIHDYYESGFSFTPQDVRAKLEEVTKQFPHDNPDIANFYLGL
ncbi:MAG TPA: hypothetical protein VHA52_12030, partial [Candidatus Babeliaceae bacterium]|nr:hypothetical protein [Candidatus Babeliaceae bacterium]